VPRSLRLFRKGRVLASRQMSSSFVGCRNRSPAPALPPIFVISKAAPQPPLRFFDPSPFNGVAMHVAQFLHSFALGPHIEIIKARLPYRHRPSFPEDCLSVIAPPAPAHNPLRESLLHTLHGGRRVPNLETRLRSRFTFALISSPHLRYYRSA